MKRYVVVGAGAAGLTLAYHLCKAGLPVTVLEKEPEVGGLARSFHYDEWHFDIGPHRFYSANPMVKKFLSEVLGDDFVEISRSSAVHYMGHYHEWPLRMGTLTKLPPTVAVRAGIDLIRKAAKAVEGPSFEDYVLRRYGRTLYETFFRDYTEKFLGVAASETHHNWAKIGVERATIDEKVSTASLTEIFKLMLMPKPAELNFWYPKRGGVHAFWQGCARRVQEIGGEVVTGVVPTRLDVGARGIEHVEIAGRTIPCEQLIWSGPIPELSEMLGLAKADLSYRSHILYNILLKSPPRYDYQWCYYGAKDLVFSRISNPATFSPHTVPTGRGGLCVEITCQMGDPLWDDPERVQRQVIADLERVRIIESEKQIEAIKIERVPFAYPIYHIDYPKKLQAARRELKAYRNLHLLGRTGKFWYNNMDHSIENAFKQASDLLGTVPDATDRALGVLEELKRDHARALPAAMPAVARA